ncbi:hypothetical protein BC830DRAFT_1105719 [Chytriomyces sp. MP71]|nr:hypothetical protein BC830DRAFT_1105719 [Chytriomyces sp. MP71]
MTRHRSSPYSRTDATRIRENTSKMHHQQHRSRSRRPPPPNTRVTSPTTFPKSTFVNAATTANLFTESSPLRPPRGASLIHSKYGSVGSFSVHSRQPTGVQQMQALSPPRFYVQKRECVAIDIDLDVEDIAGTFPPNSLSTTANLNSITLSDTALFISAIKELVYGGDGYVEVDDDTLTMIRGSIHNIPPTASGPLFPALLRDIKQIHDRVSGDALPHTTPEDISLPHALSRIAYIFHTPVPTYASSRFQLPETREKLIQILANLLYARFDVVEPRWASFLTYLDRAEKRDSNQTLVNEPCCGTAAAAMFGKEGMEEMKVDSAVSLQPSRLLDPSELSITPDGEQPDIFQDFDMTPDATRYIFYTGQLNAFTPLLSPKRSASSPTVSTLQTLLQQKSKSSVAGEAPPLHTAIARIPSTSLHPGDRLILLSGWQDPSNTTPATNTATFLPPPPDMVPDCPPPGRGMKPNGPTFETAQLAHLECADHLFSNYTRLTVRVLSSRSNVPFHFSGPRTDGEDGFEEGRVEVQNRVRDALRWGGVRVGKGVEEAFFW